MNAGWKKKEAWSIIIEGGWRIKKIEWRIKKIEWRRCDNECRMMTPKTLHRYKRYLKYLPSDLVIFSQDTSLMIMPKSYNGKKD